MNSLKKYWQKRRFEKTSEPKGKVEKVSKNRFVIHNHYAKKAGHHHDLRLEMPSVAKTTEGKEVGLKSWAVPKGVPEKVGVKRLAIAVEDHQVDYIDFEGKIPEGLYGAGTVKIFDKGKYELIKKTKDRTLFKLKGKKLKGSYNLLKLRGRKNQWLLFKTE